MGEASHSGQTARDGVFLTGIAAYTGNNPEGLGMGPVPPGLKLVGLVLAVQRLVRNIRAYFPVKGVVGAYPADVCSVARRDVVGLAFDDVEGWLNPGRLQFDDPQRRDPDRICGLPERTLQHRPLLHETICCLVEYYDGLLAHYQLESLGARKESCLLWWDGRVKEIDAPLLEQLQQAAATLESRVNASDHLYLDRAWCEKNPDRAGAADYGKTAAQDESTEPFSKNPEVMTGGPRPGFLGLILVETERVVRRRGYSESVCLGDCEIRWKLLKALIRAAEQRLARVDLIRTAWEPNEPVEENTLQKHMSLLRKDLILLGIRVHTLRNLGYRLKDKSEDD